MVALKRLSNWLVILIMLLIAIIIIVTIVMITIPEIAIDKIKIFVENIWGAIA